MKELILTKNKTAIVDDDDYEYLNQWKWTSHSKGYAYRNSGRDIFGNTAAVFLHRFITDCPKNMIVDHINQNKLDNRRQNLRICTQAQNARNKPKRIDNKSGYKGVVLHQKGLYRATCSNKNKQIHFGYFKDPHHAALAYDLWVTYLFGEYAKTNFKVVSYR